MGRAFDSAAAREPPTHTINISAVIESRFDQVFEYHRAVRLADRAICPNSITRKVYARSVIFRISVGVVLGGEPRQSEAKR